MGMSPAYEVGLWNGEVFVGEGGAADRFQGFVANGQAVFDAQALADCREGTQFPRFCPLPVADM
jgi:hypothetical protein